MQKRVGFTWIEAVVIVGILAILAAILFPVFMRARDHPPRRSSCQSHLKIISLGIKQYQQDYTEMYPLVVSDFNPYGWADAIQPYLKSTQPYHCPQGTNQQTIDPILNNYTDYWFNSQIAGVVENYLSSTAYTIMLGDGNDGTDATNARYAISRLPAKWLKDTNSPAYRHLGGLNFAFADGHIKWYKADKLSNSITEKYREGKISFSPNR